MSSMTFVVPVGDESTYRTCFLRSPLFHGNSNFQILAQVGFETSGQAFNDAIEKAENDIIVFAHQDVVFPVGWAARFCARLDELQSLNLPMGVAGCIGITAEGNAAGHIYRRDREILLQHPLPAVVQTLDEMLICCRRSSGLQFDVTVPSFFGYATDLCLQASSRGLHNFAVDAPCFHQAKNRKKMAKEFHLVWEFMLDKWKDVLPVYTLSGTMDGRVRYRLRSLKQSLWDAVGYSPEPWWTNFPKIKPEDVLFGSASKGVKEDG